MKEKALVKRIRRYARRYAKKININCCQHIGNDTIKYHIAYLGCRWCKVAICVDCDDKQIICTGFFKWLLKKILKKGYRRFTILATVTNRDLFMYR